MPNLLSALSKSRVNSRRLLPAEEIARLAGHPELPGLAAAYCLEMTAAPVRWPLRKLVYQEARYVICFHVIANHSRWRRTGGAPPTLAAVQTPKYASERQVAGFVARLRRMGLITATPLPADRRMIVLQPSPSLIEEVSRHPRLMVDLHMALTGQAPLAPASRDPDWITDLMIRAASAERRETLSESPFSVIASFARHDCGYLILAAILLAHYQRDAQETGRRMDLTYAGLSSWFGTSTTHVANLMREARTAGWFATNRGGELRIVNPALVQEFENFLVEQAAHFGRLARGMLTDEAARYAGTVAVCQTLESVTS